MIELTSHQGKVGDVLGFGNQLIADGVVSEREEGEIRDQLINLNDRWEALRVAAMDRQSKYGIWQEPLTHSALRASIVFIRACLFRKKKVYMVRLCTLK